MVPAGTRPLIGITTYRQVTRWWAWERDAALVPGPYLDVVEAAGGQAVLIPPGSDDHGGDGSGSGDIGGDGRGDGRFDRLVGALDGLVLIGGGDVGASRYGQPDDERNGGTNPERDELEIGLVRTALDRDLPLLAVCRGLQVLNVALGGTLVQQLPDRIGTSHQPRAGAFGTVAVSTVEGSIVRRLMGEEIEVQCSHHQAIAELGERLVVTGTSDDGVIEAVEVPDLRFVVGVQWHPEETGDTRLFEGLVDAASRL